MKIRIARPTGKYRFWQPEWKYASGTVVTQEFETVRPEDDRIKLEHLEKLENLDESGYRFIETRR